MGNTTTNCGWKNTEVRQMLGDKDVDGRILFGSILNKEDMWQF